MEQQPPLVCPSHTTQYIVAVIVGIIVGVGASFVYFKQAPASIGGGTYQEGFDTARARVLESPMGMIFKTPDDIRTISGAVTAISGNQITIHTESQNPFDDPALADRTITLSSDTKITKLSQGAPADFQAEMDAFMKKMQSGKDVGLLPPVPPEPARTTVEVSGIKVGDTLTVTATENIKIMKEFTASEIQIQ